MISLSDAVEKELLRVAGQSKRPLQVVVEEAVRQYLDGLAITDVEPADVSAAQITLAEELPDPSPWPAEQEGADRATG